MTEAPRCARGASCVEHCPAEWEPGRRRKSKKMKEAGARSDSTRTDHAPAGTAGLLLGLLVGIDHVAGLEFGRREDGLRRHALELLDVVALHAVILDLQHARGGPLAVRAKRHRPHDRAELGLVHVVGELAIVERLGARDRVAEQLDIGVAPRARVIAERIDALPPGPGPALPAGA